MSVLDDHFAQMSKQDAARTEHRDVGTFSFFLLKKDPLIVDGILPQLEDCLTSNSFAQDFLDKFRKNAQLKRELLATQASNCEQAGFDSRFYTLQMLHEDRRISIDSMESYLAYLADPSVGHEGIIEILLNRYKYINGHNDHDNYVRDSYPQYYMGSFLYDEFIQKESLFKKFDNVTASELVAIYRGQGIDLHLVDQQFNKYKLLSINDHIAIQNCHDSQTLMDDRIGRYFWIDVPRMLLSAIESTIQDGFVKDVSFNVTKVTDLVPVLEELEIGSVFSFEALKLPVISKLYDSADFDNALWIRVGSDQSITFEELCSDFPVLNGKVITKGVHLEFFLEDGEYFINHLDHEYFIYSEEEYERRRREPGARGFAKWKSFKIDNARIPLNLRFGERYFLFVVLDAYFKNKQLLKEYFEAVQVP